MGELDYELEERPDDEPIDTRPLAERVMELVRQRPGIRLGDIAKELRVELADVAGVVGTLAVRRKMTVTR